jgi:hypothetical protein
VDETTEQTTGRRPARRRESWRRRIAVGLAVTGAALTGEADVDLA